MTSGKVIAALAPLAAAGAFAGGMMVQQRQAPAAPQGILGAGVFVPASAGAKSGYWRPGGRYNPGGKYGPAGAAHPGGLTKP